MKTVIKKGVLKPQSYRPFFSKKDGGSFFQNEKEDSPFFGLASAQAHGGTTVKKDEDSLNENESGNLPDVMTPPGMEIIKEEGEAPVLESQDTFEQGNVTAKFNLNFVQPKTDSPEKEKEDPVTSGVSLGSFSQPSGKVVKYFGAESYAPAFKNVKYEFKDSKCTIQGDLDVKCPWGTDSGGRTDVPSATDAVVTKADWADIKNDLTPRAASPYKSPRTKYYSKKLVERHERFHGTDDLGWTKSSGLDIAKTVVEAGNLSSGNANTEGPKLLEKARKKLVSENLKWYKGGGTNHGSYAGEIRAYSNGKDAYKKLADDVEAHGKTL